MDLEVAVAHRLGAFELDVAFAAPGGVTALFGPSGSGKTTVANAVAGLLSPARGRIALGGRVLLDTGAGVAVPAHLRRVGYVFQEGRLFPHLSVRGNLMFGHRLVPRGEPREDPGRVAALLGLEALLARRPRALSGGEKQRVAIGRALLSGPRLLVMDEPLTSLDEPRRAEILPHLERLRDEAGVPILYVSHSAAEIARLAATVVVIEDGRVARMGPAAEVLAPGAAAVLTARVVGHGADGTTAVTVGAGRLVLPRIKAPPGAELRLRIEARDVVLALEPPRGVGALGALPSVVVSVADGPGDAVVVTLASGAERLGAVLPRVALGALGLAPGMRCHALPLAAGVLPAPPGGRAASPPPG